MLKLVLILIAFIAVANFIRAFDDSGGIRPNDFQAVETRHTVESRQ